MWSLLILSSCTSPKAETEHEKEMLSDGVVRAEIQFQLPLADPTAFDIRIGMDHDLENHDHETFGATICTDYLGRSFPHCYDDHMGTDYILVGGFDAMDDGSQPILAAAAGVVIDLEDGHYDRCHGDISTFDVSCDGFPMVSNQVTLRHPSGHVTYYWHMKKDSIAVELGDEVERGDILGLVGSSGWRSMPHLHFEVETPIGVVVDPYSGPYSQEETYWCEQSDPLPGYCDE